MEGKIWVFTGGVHAAGGFAENKGFRNSAGLFEEVIRWDMRGDDVAGRENFVFNTASEGLDVSDIIRDFQQRVGRYHPAGVVYLSGAEDRKLEREVFGEKLQILKGMAEGMGARFLEMDDGFGADSLGEANRLLELACGGKSLVGDGERGRYTLKPARSGFARNGSLILKPEPMRWLFIGDSITHGALHTWGYDSLPQLWEKYIRGDWGRRDDTVLNTGVSGATACEFLERLDKRYTPYADADVVVMMFGTNDCVSMDSAGEFKRQLRSIVELARSHGSQVVLRIPPIVEKDAGERREALSVFADAAREAAGETAAIAVDHFRSFRILEEDPEGFHACMGDAVHPNAKGQYRMFREMAYAVDMVKEDSMVSLEYDIHQNTH